MNLGNNDKQQVGCRGNADDDAKNEGRRGKTDRFKKDGRRGDGREKEMPKKKKNPDELLGKTEEAKEGER